MSLHILCTVKYHVCPLTSKNSRLTWEGIFVFASWFFRNIRMPLGPL